MTAQAASASGAPARGAPARAPRRRDPERKERILVAAAALGAARGFDAISMADIGAEAGIGGARACPDFRTTARTPVAKGRPASGRRGGGVRGRGRGGRGDRVDPVLPERAGLRGAHGTPRGDGARLPRHGSWAGK